jgi:hypothetical protein
MSQITFRALDDAGRPVAGVLLGSAGGLGAWQAVTDAAGQFVAGLGPGRYLVTAAKDGAFAPASDYIDVTSAPQTVLVRLAALGAADPRDAQIASLEATVAAIRAQLAALPAALSVFVGWGARSRAA